MAEDFDKEASYVEENETIVEIFPELLVVKNEILNYYDNEFESTPFSVQENKGLLLQEEIQSRHFQPPSSDLTNNDNSQIKLLNCNKIILGSKPNTVSSDEGNYENIGKIMQEKNDVSVDGNYFEESVTSYEPSVELQDIQPYLHKSKRFCDSCSILFAEPSGYESHLLIFHSENRSPGISDKKNLSERRQHKCTICAKQFVARHVLRTHLINIHKMSSAKAFEMTIKKTSANGIDDTSNAKAIEMTTKEMNAKGINDTSNAKAIDMTTKETSPKEIENTSNAKPIKMTTKETSPKGIEHTSNAKPIEMTTKETSPKVIEVTSNAKPIEITTKGTTAKAIEDTTKDTSGKRKENTVKETNATVFKITTKYINEQVVENTIKETNTPKINHESSDLSNTCFHCKKAFDTQKSLIEHLYDILQMKRKNTELVPVLKSILFKCNKCDIHFTSSQLAANHAEHMEMLINWKCTICNRIFKKEDELSHERQHSVSNHFLTYNLGDLDVANILFRCSKCATHFTESNFLYHFRDCGLEVTKTFTCKICNILLDYTLKTLHEFDKHTESKPFTIIQCDVISDNPVKSTVSKPQTRDKLKELLKSFREVKIVLKKIDSCKSKSSEVKFSSKCDSRMITESSSLEMASNELPEELHVNKASGKLWGTRLRKIKNTTGKYTISHGLNKNKPVNHKPLGRRNMTYSYCKNCKCFVTKFRRDVHLKGRCNKLTEMARTCEYCGLILTSISIMAHKRLHMERKGLKLTSFKFINLFNGRPTHPPIPEYPKCTHCDIYFLSKMDRMKHICGKEPYETCDLCGIKLTESAFKLHMTFHEYANDRMKRLTMKNLQAKTLNIAECDIVKNITNAIENNTELIHNQLDMDEPTLNENTSRPYTMNDNNKLDTAQVINKKKRENIAALRRLNVTYCYCETCKCFVTKFKKAVHVQGRCKNMGKIACTCEHCGLILTSASMVTHRRLHREKKDLKLKNFRFFNLYTGRSMNPPIPEYPRCTHCDVHFLTTAAINNHNCSKQAYQTCNICETKLSESAFKLHMAFHQYATDRIKRIIPNNFKEPTTLDVVNCVADETVVNTSENYNQLPNNLNVAETKVTAVHKCIRKRRNICQKYEIKGLNVFQTVNKNEATVIADLRRRNWTYFYCDTCKCFVTKFKKAAHVQGRCKNMAKIACTCEHCGLILNSGSIVTHRRLHMEKRDLKLKHFRFFDLYNGRSINPPIPNYPKCNNCAVHFLSEELTNNHICNVEAHQKCNLCDIQLSKAAFKLHVKFHQYETDRIKITTLNNSQTATNSGTKTSDTDKNVTKSSENNIDAIDNRLDVTEMQQTANTNQEYKLNDNTNLDASLDENKKTLVNIADHLALTRRNVTYSYCENCKCFITKFRIEAHIQGRCKKLPKIACTCEDCGLILNDASIVTHKRLHEENKDLKLKNFKFFNMYTGISMNPPIPEYPKCTHCAVHFLTETARNKHICSQQAYRACHVCEMKLSQAAFKRHISFHQYASDHMKNSQSATSLVADQRVSDENVNNNTENNIEAIHYPPDVTETKLTANTNQEYKLNDNITLNASLFENKIINNADALRRRNLTYSYCETCKCFITKFRKDAHVEQRCKKLAKIACTCEYCGLILNDASIVTHRRLHEDRKDLQLKNFIFFNLYTGRPMNPPIPTYPECKHCTVQFLTKKAKNNHICTEQSYQTCHLCGTKLSEVAFKLHMMFHQYPSDRLKKDTTVNSQSVKTLDNEKPLTDEKVNSTESDKERTNDVLDVAETRLIVLPAKKMKMNSKRKFNDFQAVNSKRLVSISKKLFLRRRNVTYSFCETCKCFVTNFKKDAHVEGRCKNMAKTACTCEHCGLILNSASIVTHRRLHEETKDLKLKNFRFFNLYTGRSMKPPIPKYPKCTHCAVHFLSNTARKDHICSKEAYDTCHLCEIKLTEPAFKLHMKFHEYATDRMKRVIMKNSQNSQSPITSDIDKRVTNEDVSQPTENKVELICNPLNVAEFPVQHSSEPYEIVYTCGNCSVSVNTYDKVVEHCQRHYENENPEIETNICNYCELTIDAVCYTDHYNLHEKGKQFKFLKFDSYYLPADNNMWVTHIFKTIPKEKVVDILRSSIYRFECRMKMEVIQQGDPNLTVYKCDQCSCFIEPASLFKHSDNSCFKLRHHSCTVCGIPFNSSTSRIDHEKIHNRPGITSDLYRIVVFNRERDKHINRSFCLRKNYVLFQCRNCSVIMDKPQGDDNIHKCDVSNVKKCQYCALLLHSKDFEKHVNTHENFVSFNYSNMKVILLGENNFLEDRSKSTLASNFKGAIYDYKMFICNKCEICVKDAICMSKHICRFGKQRLKCLKCNLYFSVGRLKTHTRSHEQDADFIRPNMNIVSFDPCTFDQNKNTTVVYSKESEYSDSNSDSDTEILAANDTNIANVAEAFEMIPQITEEETVKLYRCTCELHFLNEDSIVRHFGVCRSKATISKQKCPKCDLLFTPNVLFTHLLAHHSKNSLRYKYDVVEMDCIQNTMVQ